MYIHDIVGVPKESKPPVKTFSVFFIVKNRLKVIKKLFRGMLSHDAMYLFPNIYKTLRLVGVILCCQNLIAPLMYFLQHIFYRAVYIYLHKIYNCLRKQPLFPAWLVLKYAANSLLRGFHCDICHLSVLLWRFPVPYVMGHQRHSTI